MMHKELSRVLVEYVLWVEALQYKVKGRVIERIDGAEPRFLWEVSHHYVPLTGEVGQHYPTATRASTREAAEALLLDYLRNFTDNGVVANDMY